MKTEDFYDAVWERLCALRHYKLISRGRKFRISKRGEEFLKNQDKEYYLAKITIEEKLKRTRYPEILLASLQEFLNLKNDDIKAIKNFLEKRGYLDFTESVEIEKDFEIWWKFVEKIHKRLGEKATKEKIAEVFDRNMRKIVVGTKALIDFDLNVLRRVLGEIEIFEKRTQSLNEFEEADIEELIRRNFENIFPSMEIIDNGRHYRTKAGFYIDILAKEKRSKNIL
ncbi:MAG: hypothetical protein QXM06_03785 [Archaeoglobaceae archaeon]